MRRHRTPLLLGAGILLILAGLLMLRIFGKSKMPEENSPVVKVSRSLRESRTASSEEPEKKEKETEAERERGDERGTGTEREAEAETKTKETESKSERAGTAPSSPVSTEGKGRAQSLPAAPKAGIPEEINDQNFDEYIKSIIRQTGKSHQAIYRYITENYIYRDQEMDSARRMAISMCNKGGGNCLGYASLVHYLCRAAGMEDHIIKGESPAGLHYWNLVEIEPGVWRYMDASRDNAVILEETDEGLNAKVAPLGSYYIWDRSQWSSHSPSGLAKDNPPAPSAVAAADPPPNTPSAVSVIPQTSPVPSANPSIQPPRDPSEESDPPNPSDSLEGSTAAEENEDSSEKEDPSENSSGAEGSSQEAEEGSAESPAETEESTAPPESTQPETEPATEASTAPESQASSEETEASSSPAEATDPPQESSSGEESSGGESDPAP